MTPTGGDGKIAGPFIQIAPAHPRGHAYHPELRAQAAAGDPVDLGLGIEQVGHLAAQLGRGQE
jgi:hypothetical protein